MQANNPVDQFLVLLKQSLDEGTFVKLSLGNYNGPEASLKNIYVRSVEIKREKKLSFTYRYKTNDIVKNYNPADGFALITAELPGNFKIATFFTADAEVQVEALKSGVIVLREKAVKLRVKPEAHDKVKKRLIQADGKAYLTALGITDAAGNVFKNAQDKYKQINQYISLLAPLIKEVGVEQLQQVADMGAGKGYLTFALYDYLHNVLGLKTSVTGVEYREDLVELCNSIAAAAGFNQLKFEQGTIEAYNAEKVDMLIALHACDTATDDAIYSGIKANAELIVVAPCCHKQVRREMDAHKASNDVSFLTRHGIFMERQAEMVTDGLRALILEYAGYKVKVFEFISDAHTPKNVLVVGVKAKSLTETDQASILQKIKATKAYFGIGYHHLERLMQL